MVMAVVTLDVANLGGGFSLLRLNVMQCHIVWIARRSERYIFRGNTICVNFLKQR